MRKIMGEVPRALEVVAHDDQDLLPMGRKKVSRPESNRRTEEFVAGVANGQIPLDDQAAEVIKHYLDQYHARQ